MVDRQEKAVISLAGNDGSSEGAVIEGVSVSPVTGGVLPLAIGAPAALDTLTLGLR